MRITETLEMGMGKYFRKMRWKRFDGSLLKYVEKGAKGKLDNDTVMEFVTPGYVFGCFVTNL